MTAVARTSAAARVAPVARLDVYRLSLPLAEPLRHAKVATAALDEVFLVLTTATGAVGVGEVRGNGAYATGRDAASVLDAIRSTADRLLGRDAGSAAERLLAATGNRLAAALVDGAALDALARAAGKPLCRYLGGSPTAIPTHASIGFVGPDRAASLAGAAATDGFRRIKVRVGSERVEEDVARVAAVRAAVPPDVAIAVDANGAWGAPTAIRAAERLAPYGIAWLEQPTPAGDHAALRAVRARTTIPVIADEAIRTPEDVARTAAERSADGVHLKLEKCGTVAALRRAAEVAREAGLSIEIGQMDQGRVGSAALAHVAATIPADAYELWGFERVARDVGRGLEPRGGAIVLGEDPGHGVTVGLPETALVMSLC